jgi:hypothetical protein
MEAVRYFADADRTLETMVALRWPTGVHCPTCGRVDVRFIATRRLWECKEKHPKRQFSAKVGTIFEDSPLPLDKWFVAVWSVANCKNGISSYELARAIGVTQKSAWHMLHRIRVAMEVGGIEKFTGEVEGDETYVGGRTINKHANKKPRKVGATRGRSSTKDGVAGLLRRTSNEGHSQVRLRHFQRADKPTLHGFVRENVEPGSRLLTDAWLSYRGLAGDFTHEIVDHASEYVRGSVHTNGIENFWSLLKRTIKGTYVSVEPFHLGAYLAEQAFRFNEREGRDYRRFAKVLSSVVGKRLTYEDLIGHGALQGAH